MLARFFSILLVCGMLLAGAVLAQSSHDKGPSVPSKRGVAPDETDIEKLQLEIEKKLWKIQKDLKEDTEKVEKDFRDEALRWLNPPDKAKAKAPPANKREDGEKALVEALMKALAAPGKPGAQGKNALPQLEDLTPELVKTMPLDKLEAVAAREVSIHILLDDIFRKDKRGPALNMEHTALLMLIEGQKGIPPTRLNLQFAMPGGKQLPDAEKRALLVRVLGMADYVFASHESWLASQNVNPEPWRRLVPREFGTLAADITIDYYLRNRNNAGMRERYPFFHVGRP